MPNSYYGYSMPSETGYWTRRKWFTLTVFIFLLWLAVYLFAHSPNEFTGYKYTKFSTEQVTQITNVLINNEIIVPTAKPLNDTTTRSDSSNTLSDSAPVLIKSVASPVKIKCDSCGVNKAMIYISGEFGDKIDERQLYAIREYMLSFGPFETSNYLASYKLKMKNFFWLVGPSLYIEAIFWTIIGVFCSILFAIGVDIKTYPGRRNSKYYSSQIPYDVAKFFYAPFCTIIILLCYNYIKHRNIIEVNTSEGMIVFAFMTGLFAGRLMGTFAKIKDAVIPEYKYTYKPYALSRNSAGKNASLRTPVYGEPLNAVIDGNRGKKARGPFPEMPPADIHHSNTAEDIYNNTGNIREIKVDLKLDSRGLFEDEKAEILKSGFNDAVMTLHNVNGKDIVHLKKSSDSSIFTMANIIPGIYIVRATLTRQLSDRFVINLFGEKTVFFTHENSKAELYIKKYEALD